MQSNKHKLVEMNSLSKKEIFEKFKKSELEVDDSLDPADSVDFIDHLIL